MYQLIAELYLPFFTVQIRPQTMGGSMYFATNQCAGAGSARIKAQRLLKAASARTKTVNSILASSLAMDGRSAELYIYFLGGSGETGESYHVATAKRHLSSNKAHCEALYEQRRSVLK